VIFPERYYLMERLRKLCISLSLILPCLQWTTCFNLDIDKPYVFSGPEGSYFGFSVDFFQPDAKSNILIGAPKANTSSASTVVERGAVYTCPWQKSSDCTQVQFDNTGEYRRSGLQMEFKSNQWFGATVRSHGEHILACAPLYQWSTYSVSEREPVGTCFLKKGQEVVEYSPCRSSKVVVGGPGSFYWQGQLISDDISEIITRFNRQYYTPYSNQLTTKSASAQYDDSYLGKSCCPKRPPIPSIVTVLMAAYFGHSVAATDINNDGLVDLFVGAPLFMDRGSDGKLREVGQVSVFLGKGGFSFNTPITLSGTEIYSRFGSSIATLGDLDMDGFNDIAIAAPYGGPKHRGLVYIHNGRAAGPDPVPSQVLEGRWASSYMPPSFGYSLHGATDIDQNGYPDLIVGVFGADKAVLYRARPVISVNATLDISPQILNPEERSCKLPDSDTKVSCFKVKYCLKASGRGAPDSLKFQVHLVLDRLKHKGATKRVLFLHSKTSQYTKNMTVSNGQGPACEEQEAFLIDDSEFRDKITPISVFMEFSLDYQQAADKTGLLPILEQTTPTNISKQAHVLLDCGDDNICKPDLKLSVVSDQKQIYIGDDNPLTLEVTAENRGEGAYEAELHVFLPPQADFTGVVRNSETLSRLSCAYKTENQTRVVVCDLGNPMKGGIKVLAGLRFSVHQLSEQDTLVKFDLQIQSSNQFNSTSSLVSSITTLAVLANVDFRGVALPDQVFLPIANWKSKENPVVGEDIGPRIQHIYELRNRGPSTFSKAILDIEWPYRFNNGSLLYITELEVDRGMNCSTDMEINPLNVSVCDILSLPFSLPFTISFSLDTGRNRNHVHRRELAKKEMEGELETLDCSKAQCLKIRCQVGRVERGQSTTLYVHSRLGVATFLKTESQNRSFTVRSSASFSVIEMPYNKNLVSELPSNAITVSMSVIWLKSDPEPVPGWVVALAVLAGLLLLALLIFIMYKLGFFKRVRPPQEDNTEKEQLAPQENGDRNNEA
uniref:Integrin alpha-2 domain-containing protein n=1 Tax=Oncorhynchus mykiss TaxID=8022 RepID=A0A8K9UL47_ONCMY